MSLSLIRKKIDMYGYIYRKNVNDLKNDHEEKESKSTYHVNKIMLYEFKQLKNIDR